jgi:hypothetical protein
VRVSARSAEVVVARTVGALVAESLIRSRTTPPLLVAVATGVVAIVLAIVLGGAVGVLLGLVGLALLVATAMAFLLRAATLAVVRRFAGGPDFAVARPIVQRHLADLRTHGERLPMGRLGVLRLVTMARRPTELHAQMVGAGEGIARAVPQLVADVRTALPRDNA